MDFLFILVTFNLLILPTGILRLGSRFLFFSLFILFFISLYAVIKTNFHSFYLLPLIGSGLFFFLKRESFVFERMNFNTIIAANLLWLIFFFIFFLFPDFTFKIHAEDYIIYSRIAYYNDLYGVENIKTFYNLLQSGLKNDIYHYTEIWGMALFRYLNGVSLIKNYFFLVCPIFLYLIFLGVSDLGLFKKNIFNFAFVVILLFVVFPYDIISKFLIDGLPIVGVGNTIFSLKNLFVFPLILIIYNEFKKTEKDYFIISLLSFFYPILIPVVIGSLFVFIFFYEKYFFKCIKYPLIVIVYFILYLFIVSQGGVSMDFFHFINLKILSKVAFVGFFIPLATIIYSLSYLKRIGYINFDFIIYSFIVISISLFLWILFSNNIDSNQFFRNIFHSLFVLLIGFHIVINLQERRVLNFLTMILIFVAPVFILYYKTEFINYKIVSENKLNQYIVHKNSVLVVPNNNSSFSIYDYNEKMYNPFNKLFILNENLNLINISSSFPESRKVNNESLYFMFNYYRIQSPFFNYCGQFDIENECVVSFMKNYKIDYVLASNLSPDLFLCLYESSEYSLYKVI